MILRDFFIDPKYLVRRTARILAGGGYEVKKPLRSRFGLWWEVVLVRDPSRLSIKDELEQWKIEWYPDKLKRRVK